MKINSLTILLLLCLCVPAAQAAVRVDTPNGTVIDLGSWSGGDISESLDLCVVSVDGNIRRSTTLAPYRVRAFQADGLSGNRDPFEFLPTGAVTAPGAGFDLTFTDLVTATDVLLPPRRWTGYDNTALARQECNGGAINARLTLAITEAELLKLPAGVYSRGYRLQVQNSTANQKRKADLTFQINVQEVVKISDLADIDLGTYSMGSDMTHSQSVCVFTNALSNSYNVTATALSQNGGNLTEFLLDNGSRNLPYQVEFAREPLGYNDWSSNNIPADASVDCSGGIRAPLQVKVLTVDAAAATAGTYAGTLVLTVSPA